MEPTLNIIPATPEDFSAFQPEYDAWLDMVEASFEDEEPTLEADDLQEWRIPEDNYTDVEADADTLASAGMGTDEDYGYFGDEF